MFSGNSVSFRTVDFGLIICYSILNEIKLQSWKSIMWAIGAAGSGPPPSNQHPLCKALDNFNGDVFLHTLPSKYECHGHDDGLTCVARVAERKPFPAQCEENLADRDAGSEALVGHLRNPQTASESCCKRVWIGRSPNRLNFDAGSSLPMQAFNPPAHRMTAIDKANNLKISKISFFVFYTNRYLTEGANC